MGRKPHKFDPASVAKLERPERQRFLPNDRVVSHWRADVEREAGPPAGVSLTPEAGREMLEGAGFDVVAIEGEPFPYHLACMARRPAEGPR